MDGTKESTEGPLRSQVLKALHHIACCDYRFGVGKLGLVQEVQVSEGREVAVKVLPCCIFGMARLVTSVKEGLQGIEGIAEVDVEVAWDRIGDRDHLASEGKGIFRFDLEAMVQKHGLKGWGSSSQKA